MGAMVGHMASAVDGDRGAASSATIHRPTCDWRSSCRLSFQIAFMPSI